MEEYVWLVFVAASAGGVWLWWSVERQRTDGPVLGTRICDALPRVGAEVQRSAEVAARVEQRTGEARSTTAAR